MDEKNGKILDLNHVKVLLLEAEFLEEKDKKGELYQPPHLKRRLKAGSGG